MSNPTPTDEKCNAETRDGGYCEKYPVGDGNRCRMHGGDPDAGAPTGNGNAETHGLTADREAWFERHREDVEPYVRTLVESYVEDAPFGWDATAKVDKLVEVAIDQARLRESNAVVDEFLREQVVGTRADGTPVTKLEEHPAHLPRDRIKRTNLRVLDNLGVLDEPDESSDGSEVTIAELLSDSPTGKNNEDRHR